ncbi:hypothetical protein M378DRAFT_6051 [Amanita muscaria Koide BX008]|uniref:Uncharacterized protein n=1 Tax=Amanita muscaria (strain Koide BX008) TaxID=946122 RepID=A0A0C2TV79_AMAMK|nr:hypothetical protein M378DRAFT_6051 [Amanita muscaria Koide BX008]
MSTNIVTWRHSHYDMRRVNLVNLRHWATQAALSSRHSSGHSQRNLLKPSSRNYQLPSFSAISARPNTFSTKLWYRKDGTPRSKWKGVAYASVFALVCWSYSAFIYLVQDLDDQNIALSALIRFQQSEEKISSADLSSLEGSVSCMREIISGGYEMIPRAVFDRYFDAVLRALNSDKCDAQTRHKAQEVACKICERVRLGLEESKRRDKRVVDIAVDVMDLVTEQFLELQEHLESIGSEEDMAKIMNYLNKSRNEKDYEEIGD